MSDSANLRTIAHQVPLSMGFSRQGYWSGLPFPFPGDLPDPGIEPKSPAFQADSLPSEPPEKRGKGSVQFSQSVMSNSLRSHELQHARPPSPSPTPRVHPNARPSSQGCHPTISSSVVPFSSCPQSFPASGYFQMSQLFNVKWPKCWNFSFSICPSGLISFRMDWWISFRICLQSKGLSRVFTNTTVQKHQFFGAQLSSQSKSHIHT